MNLRTYSELIKFNTFKERFEYLNLKGLVGDVTFGSHRYYNQRFYRNDPEWKEIRRSVISRDLGCDLGCTDKIFGELKYEIFGPITVHHMNPISLDDIIHRTKYLLDPQYLISVSDRTHKAIHYGDFSMIDVPINIRSKNDTCLWK